MNMHNMLCTVYVDGVVKKAYVTVVEPPPPFTVPKVVLSEHELTEARLGEVIDEMAVQNARAIFRAAEDHPEDLQPLVE